MGLATHLSEGAGRRLALPGQISSSRTTESIDSVDGDHDIGGLDHRGRLLSLG